MEKPGELTRWFWSKVKILGPEECWPWTGRLDHYGYGSSRTLYDHGYPQKASRFAFQISSGVDPKGKVVRHTCDNRICCNPNHLVIGTQYDNMQDRLARGKYPTGEQHANSILTDEQRREIYRDPGTLRDIAKRYGLKSHATVTQIKKDPRWKPSSSHS